MTLVWLLAMMFVVHSINWFADLNIEMEHVYHTFYDGLMDGCQCSLCLCLYLHLSTQFHIDNSMRIGFDLGFARLFFPLYLHHVYYTLTVFVLWENFLYFFFFKQLKCFIITILLSANVIIVDDERVYVKSCFISMPIGH